MAAKLWLEISASALEHNLRVLRQAAMAGVPRTTRLHPVPAMLAVIKANAYGHGAALCAPVLARAGAEWLGVTDASEGAAVREALLAAGIVPDLQPDILVMCGLQPRDAAMIVQHRLTPVVWFPEQLTWLEGALYEMRHSAGDERISVHLEVDTGMCRQGVRPGPALDGLLVHLRRSPHLRLSGVFTHFSSAEIAQSSVTAMQWQRFMQAIHQLSEANVQPEWLHAGNTATLDEHSLVPRLDEQAAHWGARLLCRAGLGLYGYALSIDGGPATLAGNLRPVGTWKTRVLAISDVFAGEQVGYNATLTVRQPTRLALLPVGYADGLRRELSSSDAGPGGVVLVRGKRAPILGRISMNLTTVDVTHVSGAGLGDEVTLLGPGLSAEEHARLAGTVPYEILCAMHGQRELVD